jgi:hypothetical protein
MKREHFQMGVDIYLYPKKKVSSVQRFNFRELALFFKKKKKEQTPMPKSPFTPNSVLGFSVVDVGKETKKNKKKMIFTFF